MPKKSVFVIGSNVGLRLGRHKDGSLGHLNNAISKRRTRGRYGK